MKVQHKPSGAVIVTGVSTGIGCASALALVEAGYQVLGTVRHAEDGATLREAGGQTILMDVTDTAGVARAAREALALLGPLPLIGLINNAGIVRAGPVELVPPEEFRAVMEVNLVGVAALCHAFLPRLREARGRIVNISSVSGRVAAPFLAPYAASKFALEAFSDSLRRELRPHGCRVVVVQPGPIRTPIWGKAIFCSEEQLAGTVYAEAARRFVDSARRSEERGLPAEKVAAAVVRALRARRPPRRILVARRHLFYRLITHLPVRLVDLLASRR